MRDRPQDFARAEAAYAEFRRSGSPRAMAEVFDRTAPGLLLFARRLVRDASSAEDLVQQTFLRAIERANTFHDGCPLMPWLTTILANEARMVARRRTPSELLGAQPSGGDDPAQAAENREASEALHKALAQLPGGYRDVVALRYLHGMRPRHIALALDVPVPIVKTRLHRGLRKLAAMLPRGIVPGLVLAASAGRGLPASRQAVLGVLNTSVSAGCSLVGVLVMKKVHSTAAVVLLTLLALGLLIPAMMPQKAQTFAQVTPDVVQSGEAAVPSAESEAVREAVDPALSTVVSAMSPTLPGSGHPGSGPIIEVRARWLASAEAAIGIPFTLIVYPSLWLAQATSDAEGSATFDLASYANLAARAPRGVSVICALEPGRYHPVDLSQIEDGKHVLEVVLDERLELAGVVVDPAGVPVVGADVYFSPSKHHAAMPWAQTDARGRFTLRGLSPSFSVFAARGNDASAELDISNLDGGREIVLQLVERVVHAEVHVTDSEGQPVANSAVHLDDRNRSVNRRRFAVTGKDGRAFLAGIATGKYQLEVVHPSFPPAQIGVDLVAGESPRLLVVLGGSASVEGRLRFANGQPVVGAEVSLGYDMASMMYCEAHTDREGRFRLERVAIGRHYLRVSRAVPDYSQSVVLYDGPQKLDLVVPGGVYRIAGRLLDSEGQALASWQINAMKTSEVSGSGFHTTTAGDGRFALDVVSQGPWLLHVGPGQPVVTLHDVAIDGQEKVYRLPPEAVPSAYLVGRLVNGHGSRVVVSSRNQVGISTRMSIPVAEDGTFEVGPLLPGAHDLGFQRHGGQPMWWYSTVEIAARKRIDLGQIQIPLSGNLDVTVVDSLGCEASGVGLRSLAVGGEQPLMLERLDRDRWRVDGLAPGEYDVYLAGDVYAGGTAPVMQRVTVIAQQTSRITLHTAPGAILNYRLVLPPGVSEGAAGWQRVTIRNASGAIVLRSTSMGSLSHRLLLLEGSYSIDVATGAGYRGSARFALPSADNETMSIQLLR